MSIIGNNLHQKSLPVPTPAVVVETPVIATAAQDAAARANV